MALNTETTSNRVSIVSQNEKQPEKFSHTERLGELSEEDRAYVEGFSEDAKKKALRKVDIRLIPMLTFLYLISFLDRANIVSDIVSILGNAKIEGLMEDPKLDGTKYNIALSIFFVPYVLLEVPSNTLLLKFKRPSTYLAILVTTWGVMITLTGIVQNFAGLVVCRFLLGVFESGFFPGAVYLISRWYLPHESQARIALFYTASALAGAFSGLLAFGIAKLDGLGGLEGWRWIFILEGIASVIAGIMTFFFLIDTPTLSPWLTPDEKKYLDLRQLAVQGNSMRVREAEKSRKWEILRSVLTDWQIYLQALLYWSNTIPSYVLGAISAYVSAVFSDKFKWRMPFTVGAQLLVVISFSILFSLSAKVKDNTKVCYFAIFLCSVGFYPINPGGSAWTIGNLAGPTKRAQGIAFMICLGNIGGIIGSYIYIEDEKPTYPTGFGASLAFAGLGIDSCLILEFVYRNINRKEVTDDRGENQGQAY
ncbi:unnamed protein product, partial [Clonostachys rhizophaga]